MALTHEQEEWLASGDGGVSSKTIFEVMTGHVLETPRAFRWGPPADAADFGRCRRLLERFPGWRDRLGEVASRHPAWRPFVETWPRLDALYAAGEFGRLYAELSALERRREG